MTLEEFIKKQYPDKIEEYIRYITPYYYEPNVIYRTLVNGFGESYPGIHKFMIENASYGDNDMQITLFQVNKPEHKCSVSLSEAYLKLKRDIEEIPKGLLIPNNKSDFKIIHNNKRYDIHQGYWRHYESNKLGGRLWIHCDEYPLSHGHRPYYELYSCFGSVWHLKHVYAYDSVGRECYDIKFNISIRDFKEKVFGDPNIKFKHKSTEELFNIVKSKLWQ